MTGIGLAVGIAVSGGLTRLFKSMRFEVSVLDPLTFGSVAAALGLVALLASWLPARRAAKVDPRITLRAEQGRKLASTRAEFVAICRPRA